MFDPETNIRFECLKMAVEKVEAPFVIKTAREYVAFVRGQVSLKAIDPTINLSQALQKSVLKSA